MGKRFVVIGCGKIAHRHIEQVNRIGQLVGACDPDVQKSLEINRIYGIPVFHEIDELLKHCKADIAIICSPNYLHVTHIKMAVAHGLEVLCEKPLCLSSAEFADLDSFVHGSDKRVFLVLSARFHPEIIRLRQQVLLGVFGQISSFQLNACWNRSGTYYTQSNWKGRTKEDGGILFTQFSHYLDALSWCLGEIKPIAVKRSNTMHQNCIEGEDTGVALLQTRENGIGSFHWTVNSTGRNMEISLLVVGENGTKKIGGQYMDVLEYENIQDQPPFVPAESPSVQSGSHHDLIYDQLALALAGKPHHLPGIGEGLAAVSLIEAIYTFPQDHIFRPDHA